MHGLLIGIALLSIGTSFMLVKAVDQVGGCTKRHAADQVGQVFRCLSKRTTTTISILLLLLFLSFVAYFVATAQTKPVAAVSDKQRHIAAVLVHCRAAAAVADRSDSAASR